MHARFGNWPRFLISSRARTGLATVALVILAGAGWQGLQTLSFDRSLKAAQQALSAYDFPEAQRHLGSCLALRPSDPAVLLLAAQASRRDGELDQAADYLDRYRTAVGVATPQGQLESVLVQVQRGEVKEYVHRLIEDVEIRHPASEQIMEALALGCVHVYRLDEADFWTRQLRERYPENPVGRLLEAQTYDTLRQRDKALEVTRQLVDDYPRFDRARLYLAGLLFRTNQYEEAVPYYEDLHRRQPGELEPLLNLMSALVRLERLEEARPLLHELEASHSDNSQALLECARFALQENRPADAEPLLRRAVQLAPYDHEIELELATCLEQLGRADESRQHLERFQEIEADMKLLDAAFQAMVKAPSDPEPRLEAGRICLRNQQIAEGLRWLSGVLDLDPNHQAAHQILADYYESSGDKILARHHRARAGSRKGNANQ
jgi:predicted Zn-dependent protease